MIKKLLGIAPQLESDGSYKPSKLALKIGTSRKTDFENISYNKYEGPRSKILVILTEQKNLKMQNGKLFSTGNHPVEALVPLLHLRNAGFEFEIATPTGKPAVFEMWAFPERDEHVRSIYNDLEPLFEKPLSLGNFISSSFDNSASYAAVFVPGGHGSMLGIPEDERCWRNPALGPSKWPIHYKPVSWSRVIPGHQVEQQGIPLQRVQHGCLSRFSRQPNTNDRFSAW